ncbi:hypothetical protein KCP70_17535 [Salmonella enterica subsp. enterica]|nr:hypothetical protein KCP70_17535 [Salmonella enterica subsp. enterica]
MFFRILETGGKENGEKTFTVNVGYVSGQQTNGGTKTIIPLKPDEIIVSDVLVVDNDYNGGQISNEHQ